MLAQVITKSPYLSSFLSLFLTFSLTQKGAATTKLINLGHKRYKKKSGGSWTELIGPKKPSTLMKSVLRLLLQTSNIKCGLE